MSSWLKRDPGPLHIFRDVLHLSNHTHVTCLSLLAEINIISVHCVLTSLYLFFPDSPWSPAAMWRSSLRGVTTTGTWPMRASSTWETISTSPQRSSPPHSRDRLDQRLHGQDPRVLILLFYFVSNGPDLASNTSGCLVVALFVKLAPGLIRNAKRLGYCYSKNNQFGRPICKSWLS